MSCTGCNALQPQIFGLNIFDEYYDVVGDVWAETYGGALPRIRYLREGPPDGRTDSLELELEDIKVVTGDGACTASGGECVESEGCTATMSVLFNATYSVVTPDGFDRPDATWTLPDVSFAELPPEFNNEEYVSSAPTVTNSVAQPDIVWKTFPTNPGVYFVEYTVELAQTFTMGCDSTLVVTFNFEDVADSAGNILPTATGGSGEGTNEMPVDQEGSGHFFWSETGELEVTMGCDQCYRSEHIGGGGGGQGGGKNQNPNSIGN